MSPPGEPDARCRCAVPVLSAAEGMVERRKMLVVGFTQEAPDLVGVPSRAHESLPGLLSVVFGLTNGKKRNGVNPGDWLR